jgi:GNAT superfamily N-acetyltransferase
MPRMTARNGGASYEISCDPARVQVDVVHDYLRRSYWSPDVRREVVERALRHSLVAGAYRVEDGAQVGYARAVTDEATFAWLCDVFVLEQHRGHDLARRMVRALLDDQRLQSLRRWCLATRDAHGVYTPLGFAPVVEGNWLELRLPAARWSAPSAPSA